MRFSLEPIQRIKKILTERINIKRMMTFPRQSFFQQLSRPRIIYQAALLICTFMCSALKTKWVINCLTKSWETHQLSRGSSEWWTGWWGRPSRLCVAEWTSVPPKSGICFLCAFSFFKIKPQDCTQQGLMVLPVPRSLDSPVAGIRRRQNFHTRRLVSGFGLS